MSPRVLGILSLSVITATAAKALRTPGLPPHIRTAALVLGAAGWMQVGDISVIITQSGASNICWSRFGD